MSPNARVHWRTKAKATTKYRGEATFIARLAIRDHGEWNASGPKKLTIAFYHSINKRRDRDNAIASIKAALDGMQDAGVVLNDAQFEHLVLPAFVSDRNPRVVFTVEPIVHKSLTQ